MSYVDFMIYALEALAPAFVLVCFVMIIMSWLRILVDVLSGRGW